MSDETDEGVLLSGLWSEAVHGVVEETDGTYLTDEQMQRAAALFHARQTLGKGKRTSDYLWVARWIISGSRR